MKVPSAFTIACLAVQAAGAAISHRLCGFTITEHPDPVQRALLQDIVCHDSARYSYRSRRDADLFQITWDEHSLFVRGERIMIFSGEFHPFRYEIAVTCFSQI